MEQTVYFRQYTQLVSGRGKFFGQGALKIESRMKVWGASPPRHPILERKSWKHTKETKKCKTNKKVFKEGIQMNFAIHQMFKMQKLNIIYYIKPILNRKCQGDSNGPEGLQTLY